MSYKQTRVTSKKAALEQAMLIQSAMNNNASAYKQAKHMACKYSMVHSMWYSVVFNHTTSEFTPMAYGRNDASATTVATYYCGRDY